MQEQSAYAYVLVEGMDLAGKTSTTESFVARRPDSWEIRRNSLSLDNPVRDLADVMLDSGEYHTDTVGTMYAAALLSDLDRFRQPEVPTMQESAIILRSIAYQAISGTPRILQLFESIVDRHPRFDAAFVLTATYEERIARLNRRERHVTNHDLMIVRDPKRFFAMESLVVRLAQKHFHAEIIDTSDTPTLAIVEKIENTLREKGLYISGGHDALGKA